MPTPVLGTAAMVLMFPYMVYRRVKNHIGRQALNPRRLKIRIGIMLTLLTLFAGPSLLALNPEAVAALAAGAAIGFALSRLSLAHTTFMQEGATQFYVPNPWIGLALTTLLLARMSWRMWILWPTLSNPDGATAPVFSAFTPLTLAMLAAILCYNAAYLLGILTHPARPATAG